MSHIYFLNLIYFASHFPCVFGACINRKYLMNIRENFGLVKYDVNSRSFYSQLFVAPLGPNKVTILTINVLGRDLTP